MDGKNSPPGKSLRLSASRISALQKCSYSYWCKYHLHLPDTSNDGARRGSILHTILECLSIDRRLDLAKEILKSNDPLSFPLIFRYIRIASRKYDLQLDAIVTPIKGEKKGQTNLTVIARMLIVVLNVQFFLEKGEELVAPELEFDHTSEEPAYRIYGFIDKVTKKGDEMRIYDYKTSKVKFKGDDAEANIQGLMYSLVVAKKYPEFKKYIARFIFARFPNDPFCDFDFGADIIGGFENYLAYLYDQLQNFTEENAKSSYAADNKENKWLCNFCPFRRDFSYFEVWEKDAEGKFKVVKNIHLDDSKFVLKSNQIKKKKLYKGCPHFFPNRYK